MANLKIKVATTAAILGCVALQLSMNTTQAVPNPMVDGLDDWRPPTDNKELWGKYCAQNDKGQARPNYKSTGTDLDKEPIQKTYATISEKFNHVVDNSFYLYGAISKAYGLKDEKIPDGVNKNAHKFLSYLCGEFRDRATMVAAKVNWAKHMNKLPVGAQGKIDPKQNVWRQMKASAYHPFLAMSASLWNARKADVDAKGKIKMGQYAEDAQVPGIRVCDAKYIFNEYIAANKTFDNLAAYNKGFDTYSKANCDADELADFYDFRGDSNFKPNTPEGNGMIWYAVSLAGQCDDVKTANKAAQVKVTNKENTVTDAHCKDYFENPFRRRWQAARSGAATWMMHARGKSEGDTSFDVAFKNEYGPTTMLPHRITTDPLSKKPFSYKFAPTETEVLKAWLDGFGKNDKEIASSMDKPDFGFNEIARLKGAKPEELTFERLRDAVNRHTQWYQSKWDDGLGTDKSLKDQAYSPFVASSYEPSQSDAFTYCGITVPCEADGFKHWMYVFRIKGTNVYNTDRVAKGDPIDLSKMWLDETSLGTTGLANKEHAWDRLGTALEQELVQGGILYLHNITSSGDATKGDNI